MTREVRFQLPLQLPLVLLQTRQQGLALEARWVAGCHRLNPASTRVAGVGVVHDLGGLLQSEAHSLEERLMTLHSPEGRTWQLYFRGSIDFIQVGIEALHPLPPLMASRRLWPSARALLQYQGRYSLLLDAMQLKAQLQTTRDHQS